MLLNATINGVLVPCEVSVEELNKNGFHPIDNDWNDHLRTEGNEELRTEIFSAVVRKMDITSEQSEKLLDISEWCAFRDEVIFNYTDEEFAELVADGKLLPMLNEKTEELLPKAKLFEVEVEVTRTVAEKQIVTITIEAESEDVARENLCSYLGCYEVEEFIDECDWQRDDYSYPDMEIDNWTICGETDEKENFVEL